MAREIAYVNAVRSKADASSPLPKRIVSILTVLAVLILLLAIMVIVFAVLCFQKEGKLQQFEGAVQKLRTSLWLSNASQTFPVETSRSKWQTSDAAHSDIRLLEDLYEAFSKTQEHLVNISRLQRAFQDKYRSLGELIVTGWKFYKGNFYSLTREPNPWRKAEESCRAEGAQLTSITSKEEMGFLAMEARGQPFWIGLTDQDDEGVWRWVDGTKYHKDASFWGPKQPDNWAGAPGHQEDCVQVIHQAWSDVSCTYSYKGFCKKIFP